MSERFALKTISPDAVPQALVRAERYRLLNDPEQAESICLDILAVDPDHVKARIQLILALTDQLGARTASHAVRVALGHVSQLPGDYERAYYVGLVTERQGRAYLARGGMSRAFAHEALREAMEYYEQADVLKPPGVDDAILRWNACARTIMREGLQPRVDEPEMQLE